MRFLFYTGWVLLICAFIAAAAEQVVRLYPGASAIMTPAYDLWYTLAPKNQTIVQIRIERIAYFLWDPVLKSVLALPAWLLLGLPGVLLAWYCRPGRVMTAEQREDYNKYVEGLFLYDTLAKEAKAEGHATGHDDMAPDHYGHDALEAADRANAEPDDELIETVLTARRDDGDPPKLE
jgi:hypothetical protein